MMISSPTAGDPYAAAAELDRSLRSAQGSDAGPPSGDTTLESGPDIVVTLSHGAPASPPTYDASGRMGPPAADATDSSAHASKPDGGGDNAPDATSAPAATSDATADEDAAVHA